MELDRIKKRLSEIRNSEKFTDLESECPELQAEYNALLYEKVKLERHDRTDYSSNKGGLNYMM